MEGWNILIIIVAYFGLLLLVGWLTGGKSSNNTAFFSGNKRSPWYIISIGMIGTSLSGVTFVSVPGLVRQVDMTYMQLVFGFLFGYILIARILLPLYYRLNLTSIYSWLDDRIGPRGYRTGACFFLLSKLVGAAARLYLVVWILQTCVFERWHVPFEVTAVASVFLVWLYTFRGGIRTIIWTDTLQAICLLVMLAGILWQVKQSLSLDMAGMVQTVTASEHFRIFEFKDWGSTQHFVKQFLSGVFIPVVMTGLDQDMMQKNLSCRNLREAQRNMYSYGFAFIPVNFLFLCLGILLLTLAAQQQIALPDINDDILPMFCTSGILGYSTLIFFTVGIIAAAFSSADSALTALTTSFCVDILGLEKDRSAQARRTRMRVHLLVALVFTLIIIIFRLFSSRSLIDAIYMIASFTYGPLLGLFAFGLFTKRKPVNRLVPYVCIAAPLICYALDYCVFRYAGYRFGYEILLLNGALTFAGLWFRSEKMEAGVMNK
ncbi:MAG: sodium:solute symporter [Tannerella sp.]|jgi:Na+/proline symporter|nr:sodium:solute symporter [Tannerella sp.]